jgi:hypothetical protein
MFFLQDWASLAPASQSAKHPRPPPSVTERQTPPDSPFRYFQPDPPRLPLHHRWPYRRAPLPPPLPPLRPSPDSPRLHRWYGRPPNARSPQSPACSASAAATALPLRLHRAIPPRVAEQPPRSPSSLCSTPQGQFFPILSSSFPSDAAVPSHPSGRRVAAAAGTHECCSPVRRASHRGEALARPRTNLSPSRAADAHVGSRLQSFATRPLRPQQRQWPGRLPSTASRRSLWCSGSSFLAYRMID